MLEISMQTTGQMITIIVGSISIIVVLNKSIKWLKSNPVKRYIEQVSLNKLLEEKLITIHEQLNENDKKLLRDYKQRENTKTKVIDDIQEYDGDSHIKLKNLGLINEVINNTKSTNKIKEIITTTIEEQKLNQQLQQLQEIQKIVGQQIGQLNGSNVIQLTTEQLTAIENQEKTQQQEIEQLQSKLTQLQQIQQQIQQQMQTQPQQQQLLQEQINQIATQQQQKVRQIQQLNNQLFQLRQTKEALQNN